MLAAARRIAEQLLFPNALSTERGPLVPRELLDELADRGLYGLAGPAGLGGGGVLARGGHLHVVEALASGCLSTAFVWLQHHGAVLAVGADAPAKLRERWLEPLCRGTARASAAFSGLRRPVGSAVSAAAVPGGWRFSGTAPWVTGWGRVDVIRAAARTSDELIVWALVDAIESDRLRARALPLVAMAATGTVALHFDELFVARDRVLLIEPYAAWSARDGTGPAVRVNGALPLGLAQRCCRLLGPSPLDEQLDSCRVALYEGDDDTAPEARNAACELAARAALALVVSGGGRSLLLESHAQRLAREAMFLQVFGQTTAMRTAQLARLTDDVVSR